MVALCPQFVACRDSSQSGNSLCWCLHVCPPARRALWHGGEARQTINSITYTGLWQVAHPNLGLQQQRPQIVVYYIQTTCFQASKRSRALQSASEEAAQLPWHSSFQKSQRKNLRAVATASHSDCDLLSSSVLLSPKLQQTT